MRVMPKILILLMVAVLGALLACSEERLKDVSEEPEFKPVIGTRYEIVGAVDAYGIRQHSGAKIDYITLIPPPGIAGPEVGFRIPIKVGSSIAVTRVLRINSWIDPDILFFVRMDGTQMPVDVVTRIELFRGNEGNDFLQLNPKIYRRLN